MTRALVHLADRTAWLAVLRAPWCGLTLTDLHAIATRGAEGHDLSPPRASTRHSAATALAHRRFVCFDASPGRSAGVFLARFVERTWNALGGPATLRVTQDLDDADAYLHRLDQIDRPEISTT